MSNRVRTYQDLIWDQDGSVVTLKLNRPEQMNALTPSLENEFHSALKDAEVDETVRAIIVTGVGKAFCSGYDLGEDEDAMNGRASDSLRHWWNIDLSSPERHFALMKLAKPVIAAVNGWCLGGGMWYALAADITIASESATFGQPEVREIQNSTFLLAALAGWKVAHRYALTGDHFDASEAYRIGIVNDVVPDDELLAAALRVARRIALLPPDTVRLNKAITTYGLEAMGLHNAMTTASLISIIAHSSVDASDLDELHRIRAEEGLRASLIHRDAPFIPEPGGPRSKPRS